jgi:cell division control protein 24
LTDSDDEDEGEDMDPVSSLWRCLRKGTPLLTIYNSLQTPDPLRIDEKIPEAKRPKIAAFKFVEACLKGELQLPPGECFSLQDLFGDDTTGFVKVCDSFSLHPLVTEAAPFTLNYPLHQLSIGTSANGP